MNLIRRIGKSSAASACAALTAISLIVPAFAQKPVTTPTPTKKPNLIQRHPTMPGVAAGVATHAALKRSAAAKKRRHQKLNFAERHPTLSGIAAGVATRSAIKHTTPKTTPTKKP